MPGELTTRGDENEADPGIEAVGRVGRVGDRGVQPVLVGRDVEGEGGVVVRDALVVGELWARRVVQRDRAGLHVPVGPEGPA